MSAVFSTVNKKIFGNVVSQDQACLIQALLEYAAANNSGGDVLSNPFTEVSRRLRDVPINPVAQQKIDYFLAQFAEQYAAGKRP